MKETAAFGIFAVAIAIASAQSSSVRRRPACPSGAFSAYACAAVCSCPVSSACGQVLAAGLDADEAKLVLAMHNELRSRVATGREDSRGINPPQPAARNMNKLRWDGVLAAEAQAWAEQCSLNPAHDSYSSRQTPDFKWVGQNIFYYWSSDRNSDKQLKEGVQDWYDEVDHWDSTDVDPYDDDGANDVVGHYTQLVWAGTTLLGCGWIKHVDTNLYKQVLVCNYATAGNFNKGRPGAKVYDADYADRRNAGADCKNGVEKGLCCANGARDGVCAP